MEAHDRFMKHRTTEVWLLLNLRPNYNPAILQSLVDGFTRDVQKINELIYPLQYLETVRTVLCSFYKQRTYSSHKQYASKKLMYQLSSGAFNKLNVEELQKTLHTQKLDPETLSLVLDILVLQMVLYYNLPDIIEDLEKLQSAIYNRLDGHSEINNLDIKLLNCYMDSLLLHQKSPGYVWLPCLITIGASFRRIVSCWLGPREYKECQLLTVVLPKLIEILDDHENATLIWDSIFTLGGNLGNILTILCLTADLWFPMEADRDVQLIGQSMEETLWMILFMGLSSSVPEERKQALYLIKRVIDFTDKHSTFILALRSYDKIRPLICTGESSAQMSFKKNRNSYIMTLEALEEKEKHLITPVFPLWKTLLNDTLEQKNCQSGLHVAWIRCAFARMLQHDNNDIVKWGLLNVLTLDPDLYDDDLLELVLEVLNNTYLYETDADQKQVIVVKELIRFLDYAETRDNDLVTRFIVKASQMCWCPVAIYYIIHAFSMINRVKSIWKEDELAAVQVLTGINLRMECPMLRIASQIELLEIITHFATESLDLVTVANILSVFCTSEALIRGQLAWKRTCAWLLKIVKKDEVLSFLEEFCTQMMNENFQMNCSIKSASLIIMLFHDVDLIFASKSCPGLTNLRNSFNCLIGADSRLYANAGSRNRSITLIYHLLDFTSSKDSILRELISDFADASLRLIFKNLRKVTTKTLIDDISLYVQATQQIFAAESSIICKREVLNHIERFEIEAWNIIEDGEDSANVQRFFGIRILHACLKAMSTKLRNYKFIGRLYRTYRIPMTQSSGSVKNAIDACDENANMEGSIAAEYYKFVAELFYEYIKDESVDEWVPDINWIEQVLYLIKLGGNDIFVPLVGILSQIFYKGAVKTTDIDNFKSALRLCWTSALETDECRLATEEIIDLVFSSPFLECEEMREVTNQFTREVIEKADQIPGLNIILLKGLKYVKEEYLPYFYEAIVACLLHGTIPTRDQKIELQARSNVLDCYQEVYPNYLSDKNVNTDVATRAHAVTLLHKMITNDPAHAVALLPLVVAKLNKNYNKRYSEEPQIHHLQIRIMQVLLVVQPSLESSDIESIHTLICNNILSECSEPSIRILEEWLLTRIFVESETLRAKIWDLFDKCQGEPISSRSLVGVTYHVARLLSSESQIEFIKLAFEYIIPYCMVQQQDVRLFAQVIASKMYDLATELCYSKIMEKYAELYLVISRSLKYGSSMKNSIELQDDFYLKIFNPIEDYSLQTLFYELPRSLNVPSDEWIPPQMFEKFGFKESNSHPLKLSNARSNLSIAKVSVHMSNSTGSEESAADDFTSSTNCSGELQKKFLLWNLMVPNENEGSKISETLVSRRKASTKGNKIIIVASLIDQLSSMGDFSRTCEILGVTEFVVASIGQTKHEEFQRLSGSAENLLTFVEVKLPELQQYLLEKKTMGYRLVGAEQTVNSTNLMDMKFDKKTVLLLGNETAGIPANLIPLMDQCVEIPQVGVVRSLNTHVTGAICLWEYFKQHHHS